MLVLYNIVVQKKIIKCFPCTFLRTIYGFFKINLVFLVQFKSDEICFARTS